VLRCCEPTTRPSGAAIITPDRALRFELSASEPDLQQTRSQTTRCDGSDVRDQRLSRAKPGPEKQLVLNSSSAIVEDFRSVGEKYNRAAQFFRDSLEHGREKLPRAFVPVLRLVQRRFEQPPMVVL
jgi:hypothetical protein